MTVKTSISLTDQQNEFARRMVATGEYSSVSAVLQKGLGVLQKEQELHEAELAALRSLIKDRTEGSFISLDEFREANRRMIEQERKDLGL